MMAREPSWKGDAADMKTTAQGQTRSTEAPTLHRLKDSELQLADPKSDIRGRKVFDAGGEEIGKVHDLLIDEQERKVRFIEVASGGVLGVGETKFLVPIEAVTGVSEDEIRINQTGTKVAGSPRYNPELIESPLLTEVYGHYGYWTPFWGPGYVYPRYPYL
jgi:sporulation protein YlmC with PRC-barrel domain